MSKLAVGSIEGLASEGYKITVPAGSKIIQAGAVLQVVSTAKTDTWSSSINQGSYVDVTGMTATITPTATSSKVLVMVMSSGNWANAKVLRGSTEIGIADAAGNRQRSGFAYKTENANSGHTGTFVFLDSPNTTSATTYKLQVGHSWGAAYTIYLNRGDTDADQTYTGRYISTVTLMEIAG